MTNENYISRLDVKLKCLLTMFLFILSTGYLIGVTFVNKTTKASAQGIVENYNGNEDSDEAEEMKFKKSEYEMLNIIHTHLLGMSIIFFILAILVYGCVLSSKLKMILMIEPLLSVLTTFGGIYMIWSDYEWMSYVVMISGTLMTLSFVLSVALVFYNMIRSNK